MGKKKEPTPLAELTQSPTPEPIIIDPYEDLRYVPRSPNRRKSKQYTPKTKQGFVLKKKLPAISKLPGRSQRVSISQSHKSNVSHQSRSEDARNKRVKKTSCKGSENILDIENEAWNRLDERVMGPPELSAWVSPGEMPLIPPPIEVLHKTQPLKRCYIDSLNSSLFRECRSLETYAQAQDARFRLERYLMSKTGKKRGDLIIRKSQFLPKSSLDGLESPVDTEERMVTPDVFPTWAFFKMQPVTKTSLYGQLSKKQRGYDVILDWRGKPEVTDELLKKLGLHKNCLESDREYVEANIKNRIMQERIKERPRSPYMPGLGVVGGEYKSTQSTIKKVQKEQSKIFSKTENGESEDDDRRVKAKANWSHISTLIKPVNSSGVAESQASLTFGEHHLAYSGDAESATKRWIVEVGCSAEVGENSVSYVHMQNTGTTAIHYNWVKTAHKDPFALCRYDQIRFVFDSWGGTILPGEIFRVPFLYKSITTGYYSEDWRLQTKPVLENGAEIILRLWGFSRQYDPYFLARDDIEETIRASIPWNIVRNRVTKIIDYLPLQESTFKDTRFAIINLGPDLFRSKNPGLNYNTGPVYRLGKLAEMLQIRKYKRGDFGSEADTDDSDGEEEDSYISSHEDVLEELVVGGGEDEDGNDQDNQTLEVDYGTHSELSVSNLKGTYSRMIARAADIIRKRIDPDIPALKDYRRSIADLFEDEHEPDSHGSSKKVPKAPINLVNVDFTVEDMRADILKDTTSLEVQEALFHVMSSEVDKLYFRNFDAKEDWKGTVVNNLLIKAVDDFEHFGKMLKITCCEAETTSQRQQEEERLRQERLEAEADESASEELGTGEEKSSGATKTPTTTGTSDRQKAKSTPSPVRPPSAKSSGVPGSLAKTPLPEEAEANFDTPIPPPPLFGRELCMSKPPREFLNPQRYKHQYKQRLHDRMYQLLVDLFDVMDTLLATAPKDPYTTKDLAEAGFKKIRNVSIPVDPLEQLNAPLPPPWVKVSQRITTTEAAIRRRKAEVADLTWARDRH